MTTELTLPERAALALNSAEHRLKLAELVKQSESIKAVINDDGRTEAHAAAMVLRTTRTSITKAGKAAREDATAFSNAIIREEKSLVDLITPEEDRLIGMRDEWDKKIEAEKQAKIEAERKRVSAIQEAIDAMRALPVLAAGKSSAAISSVIDRLANKVPGEFFAEFQERAKLVRLEVMEQLAKMETAQRGIEVQQEADRQETERKRIDQEAEAQRIAAERAELEKLRAEQAERERIAQAELQRIADDQAAERAKLYEAQVKLAAEQAALLNRIEQERIAALQTEQAKEAEIDAAEKFHLPVPGEASPATTKVVNMPVRQAVEPSASTLNVGKINERLSVAGISLGITADLVRALGFESVKIGSASMFRESDFDSMCDALVNHINSVRTQQAA